MADLLKNNPMALRHCILFEVLQGTSIKEAYSKFCGTIGNDFMVYREFDYWYHQFLKGEYDSDFERDKDKKIYELSDMPIVVMEKIVGKLDIIDRCSLSRTSRSLRTFVEDQKLFHHSLKLKVSYSTAEISFGASVNIQYIKEYAACRKFYKNREEIFRGVPYWKQAIRDFKKILKNPKLHLDRLAIELHVNKENVFNDLENALKFSHLLNVKKLLLDYKQDRISKFLRTLKPGYLTNINIVSRGPRADSMNTVFEMEQWKQAKCFTMIMGHFIWPLHHLYHFELLHVWLLELSVEDVRQIKDFLFKSPDFEDWVFFVSDDINISIVAQEFGNALREDPYIYHFPIPNSTDYFEIEADDDYIKITRKKI